MIFAPDGCRREALFLHVYELFLRCILVFDLMSHSVA